MNVIRTYLQIPSANMFVFPHISKITMLRNFPEWCIVSVHVCTICANTISYRKIKMADCSHQTICPIIGLVSDLEISKLWDEFDVFQDTECPYWYIMLQYNSNLTLTLPGPSAGVSGSLDSYCSLKPLCSGMGEVVLARTSPTLLLPSPRTVLSLSCFKVLQCINCRD